MLPLEIIKNSPFREPTWRHDYVIDNLTRPGDRAHSWRDEDCLIRTYRRFLVALRAAGADEDRQAQVFDAYPNVSHACQLFWSGDQEDRRQLEARLLTAESLQQIADRLQMHVHVVCYFESLFFHARDRLFARDWVHLTLLRPPASGRPSDRELLSDEARWCVYRMVAYYGGAELLDDLLTRSMPSSRPSTQSEVADWLAQDLRRTIARRAFESAILFAPTDALRLIKLALKTSKATGTTSADETASQDDINKRIEMVLEKLRAAGLEDPEQANM